MSTLMNGNNFPEQKKSFSAKNKKWAVRCINAAERLATFSFQTIRQTFLNKQESYNLYNGILDLKMMRKEVNKYGFDNDSFPAKMQNYPIAVPKIDVLIGEERNKKFPYQVAVINDDAITAKEIRKRKEIELETERILSMEGDDESVMQAAEDMKRKFSNYNYQDEKERLGTHILKALEKNLGTKEIFNRGFEDLLISSEEIYAIDIVGGEPVIRKCNPLQIDSIRSGESPYIDDSDIIVEYRYMSPGQVIDSYHDFLTSKQVSQIDKGLNFSGGKSNFINIGIQDPDYPLDGDMNSTLMGFNQDFEGNGYGAGYDRQGNIRVVRVVWKSMRKIGICTYTDQFGKEQEKIVDEKYTAGEGEKVKHKWISEYWEGTRIGGSALAVGDQSAEMTSNGIFVKVQPRNVQLREAGNISKCHPGYVGICYNVNTSRALSMMDRMKPFQYLYDIFMYRTQLAYAKQKGKIGKLPIRKKPADMPLEQWMHYAETLGWLIEDDFNEGNKGAATGKLAGQMSGAAPVVDLSDYNFIQSNIQMLEYLENKMAQIVGITPQREGAIQSRETVRGVERSVAQSATITNKWFDLHDNVKCRALRILLATAKEAWKGKDKMLQYVTDENGIATLEINAEDLHDVDFDVMPDHSSKTQEMMSEMRELMHAAMQNDKMNFTEALDIINNESMSKIRRGIEAGEIKKERQMQEQQQQAMQLQQQQQQAAAQAEQAKHQMEIDKMNLKHNHDIELEAFKQEGKNDNDYRNKQMDIDKDGIPDEYELQKEQLSAQVDLEKQQRELELKKYQIDQDNKQKELDRKSKEKIASMKPKTTGK